MSTISVELQHKMQPFTAFFLFLTNVHTPSRNFTTEKIHYFRIKFLCTIFKMLHGESADCGIVSIYNLTYIFCRYWNFSNGLIYLPIQDTFGNSGNTKVLRIVTINYMVNSSFNEILQASQMVTLSLYGRNGEKLEAKLKSPVALGCFMGKCNCLISPK